MFKLISDLLRHMKNGHQNLLSHFYKRKSRNSSTALAWLLVVTKTGQVVDCLQLHVITRRDRHLTSQTPAGKVSLKIQKIFYLPPFSRGPCDWRPSVGSGDLYMLLIVQMISQLTARIKQKHFLLCFQKVFSNKQPCFNLNYSV